MSGKDWKNPTFPIFMCLWLCLLLNVFIAVRLVTVGLRVTVSSEGRTCWYSLRVVTSSPR
jgi:hypothetical protein